MDLSILDTLYKWHYAIYGAFCIWLCSVRIRLLRLIHVIAFLYSSQSSHGKYGRVVCHSLLQWITFSQNSTLWPISLEWPCTVWLLASLSSFAMTRQWCGNFERDGNTRPSYLCPEKPVCESRTTVRTLYGTTDWFKIEKGVRQVCLLSSCWFNLYSEHVMQNAGLDELQTGINQDCWEKYRQPQICGWYHFNGRKWRGTKEPLDEGERRDWKSQLKLSIKKTKIMASSPITSCQMEEEKMEAVTGFLFLSFEITADGDCSHEIRRRLLLGRKL